MEDDSEPKMQELLRTLRSIDVSDWSVEKRQRMINFLFETIEEFQLNELNDVRRLKALLQAVEFNYLAYKIGSSYRFVSSWRNPQEFHLFYCNSEQGDCNCKRMLINQKFVFLTGRKQFHGQVMFVEITINNVTKFHNYDTCRRVKVLYDRDENEPAPVGSQECWCSSIFYA